MLDKRSASLETQNWLGGRRCQAEIGAGSGQGAADPSPAVDRHRGTQAEVTQKPALGRSFANGSVL